MPGSIYVIDQQETFASPPIAMAAGPKLEFQSDQQAVTKQGEKRWQVSCAVQYRPDGQMPGQAEVITVGITGGEDPSLIITPGAQVEFARLRVGVSGVERRGDRVVGGKPYHLADGVRLISAKASAAA